MKHESETPDHRDDVPPSSATPRQLGISAGMSSQIEHLTKLLDDAVGLGAEIANGKNEEVAKADYRMLKLELMEFVYATTIWATTSPQHPWKLYLDETEKAVPGYIMNKFLDADNTPAPASE